MSGEEVAAVSHLIGISPSKGDNIFDIVEK
jgi:hypothetical protein